jgi:hypothetical protein
VLYFLALIHAKFNIVRGGFEMEKNESQTITLNDKLPFFIEHFM